MGYVGEGLPLRTTMNETRGYGKVMGRTGREVRGFNPVIPWEIPGQRKLRHHALTGKAETEVV